jgi:hypothetical protein
MEPSDNQPTIDTSASKSADPGSVTPTPVRTHESDGLSTDHSGPQLERLIPPRRLGRLLEGLREARGETIESVAVKTWGQIDVERVHTLESGLDWATATELDLLSALYAFELTDLVPQRSGLVLDFDERLIVAQGFCAVVPEGDTLHMVLRRYLTLVWALRGKPAGSRLALRELDVAVLGEGLGIGSPAVVGVLNELMDDPTWVSRRGHPSLVATIVATKIAPEAGILLSAGTEGALVFETAEHKLPET